jgi:hypothetical protein
MFVAIDPSLCPPKPKRPKKPKWGLNYVFQNISVAKLTWAKVMLRANGKMTMLKCKLCTDVKIGKSSLCQNLLAFISMMVITK